MIKKLTLNDIPEDDQKRYRKLVKGKPKKKESTGKYIVDYRLKNLEGVCIKHSTKTFDRRSEAFDFLDELKNEHVLTMYKLEHPGSTMTFAEVCEEYLDYRARKDKPGTVINRESLVKSRILPFFAETLIQDIEEKDVEEWHDRFRDENNVFIFSKTYLHALHSRLSAIFNYAVKCRYIKENPAKHVPIGSKNASARPIWSIDEYTVFKKAIEDNPMAYYAFETLYHACIRRGELLALTLADIDFENRTISINKSLSRLNGKDIVHTPKTEKSIRTIKIGQVLAAELEEHIKTLPNTSPSSRVFPVSAKFLRDALETGIKATGLKPITIHCFRHSGISNLLQMGFTVVEAANIAGHESEYITFRYAHIMEDAPNRIANAMDKLMNGEVN